MAQKAGSAGKSAASSGKTKGVTKRGRHLILPNPPGTGKRSGHGRAARAAKLKGKT